MAAARIPLRLLSGRQLSSSSRRCFSSSPSCRAAINFVMPAMSPTMTEGGVASWKVKEGDSFSTGDVLLEIETDKASMDVEAAEDGIMFKILAQDGTKEVPVGTRIAVLAEAGDDLSSLSVPEDDSSPIKSASDNVAKAEEEQKTSAPTIHGTPESPRPSRDRPATSPKGPGQNTKYPFYPSVIQLIHENHISDDEVSKIPASGPQNRLLKGDMLAYLGRIEGDYSSKQSERIEHMAHLDLSNIKIMKPTEKPAAAPSSASPDAPSLPLETSVSIPISLAEVLRVQQKIRDTMSVSLPLSTFLTRAVDIANDDLPNPKGAQPSADALFNAVLGLDSIPTTSRGAYVPQIDALSLPSTASRTNLKLRPSQKPDIIDILTGRAGPASSRKASQAGPLIAASPTPGGAMNIFTVTVPAGEEKRARTFLERMKTVLQVEPGRLVL